MWRIFVVDFCWGKPLVGTVRWESLVGRWSAVCDPGICVTSFAAGGFASQTLHNLLWPSLELVNEVRFRFCSF